jgi:FtsP/CotA-like multicopper oxidase with cupredoxin domain
MKKLALLILLLLLTTTLALAQKSVPTCNGFDLTGKPINTVSGSTVCTDYFGVANYANSPLPVGAVDTTFTITNGGSGYCATPTVTITDFYATPGATGATAAAAVDPLTGTITAITGGGGSGYMAPVVNIADCAGGLGTGAMVSAKLAVASVVAGTGMRKFVDAMPDLKANLAVADITSFPGSDFYAIGLVEYTQPLHADLPPTKLRGYCQLAAPSYTACQALPSYLGPTIVAAKNVPVRVLFKNLLPSGAGGDLFIPVDTTYMGAGLGPNGTSRYLENRATLHLHGGNTPWISDGTPHQWTVPAGDFTTTYPRGVSTRFVPDMWFDATGNLIPACAGLLTCATVGATNDSGPGTMTFYWTNQQSGRLMFYHDHAYGITRLNVYAGEAAGYLLYDPAEETSLAAATVPGTINDLAHRIPLVIQDKTFVPSAAQLAAEDPTWIWGSGTIPGVNGNGDLWFPHVYPPNQNPNDLTGANAFGRWDYGAWFFPPQSALTAATPPTAITVPCTSAAYPGTVLQSTTANPVGGCPIFPNPSGTPEGFMDTMVVNGKAFPVLHVAPEAYRFHILSAGNDRALNLSLYKACSSGAYSTAATNCAAAIAAGVGNKEVPMVPALTGGLGTAGYISPNQLDGRAGGVPDSTAKGPSWVQIGTEGGLLPNVAVIPPTPIGYDYGRRNITVLNVLNHGLLLGPAERADVIVDFTGLANQTLILYNDGPAPIPAFDPRIDYYTDDADQVQTGGAPTTLPGYAPNTRTVLQIVVDLQPSALAPFSLASLQAALPAIFNTSMAPLPAIVPEPTYPVASGGNSATATYSRIQDNTITFQPVSKGLASITVGVGGQGYTVNPTITIAPPPAPGAPATATATVVNGVITAITLTSGGSGYTIAPAVTITDATGTGATATANLTLTYVLDPKAIQELFTLDYGRMNATLGTELPLTNFLVQTTIPYGYAEWPTEIIRDGQQEIWKLTHNGVDTHFIHFHLFNVQVINRIGWDGAVKPPDPNELGWKDTLRMNPLEDIVFALKPYSQTVPFPLPDSIRSLDPTLPDGTNPDPTISGVDPNTGNLLAANGRTNAQVNFGWEYVWHCHILGHEENDMMRPVIFQVAPPVPSNLAATVDTTGAVTVSWTDMSANETSFVLQRDFTPGFTAPVSFTIDGTNSTGFNTVGYGQTVAFVDTTVPVGAMVYYRLQAVDNYLPQSPVPLPFNTLPTYSAWVGPVQAGLAPNASLTPVSLVFANQFIHTTSLAQVVTLTNAGPGTLLITGTTIAGTGAASFAYTTTCGATLAAAASCTYSVTFTPQATGPLSATLAISSNNATALNVPLSGTGIAPLAALTPTALTFAAQALNTTSAGQTVTLSNSGGADLTITSIAITGANLTDFAQTNTCGVSLLAPVAPATSTTCAISVAFTPTAIGARSASLIITTNDPVNPTLTVALSGTGVVAAASVTPASLTFAAQPLNTTSAAQTVTLSNTGGLALTINSITVTGANLTDFAQTNACGTSLAAPVAPATSTSCTISVTFTPTAVGARSASLTISTSDPANPTLTVTLSGTATVAVAAVSPVSLAFGNTAVGSTSPAQGLTLSNTGTTALTLAISFAGANPGDFTQTNACGASLAAPVAPATSTTCAINVAFVPTTAGPRSATLTITTNDPVNPTLTVALTGTGGSAVSVTPLALTFAAQPLTTTSAAQTVTLSNGGGTAVTINSITLTGANLGDFAQTNACGTSLAAAANCTISVTFTPTVAGARFASLTISTNDPVNPTLTVTLSGTGTVAAATVTPTSLAFGNVPLATTSTAQGVTLTNTGTSPLTVAISLAGANPGDFAQTNACGTSLAAGSSCSISLTFHPTLAGARSASLVITTNDPLNPTLTVLLNGTGTSAGAVVAPTSLTFAGQLVNTTSAAQTVTLSNSGTAPLTINGITITGAFAQTSTCGASLAAGANCAISVTFTPTIAGVQSGALVINSSDPVNPSITVALSGTGVTASVSVVPTALAFATQVVGTTSAAQTVTVSNTGGVAVTINSILVTGDYTQTSTCGTSLAAGASCSISVTFRPTASGTRTGSLSVNLAAPATSQTVSLSGTGTALQVTPASLAFGSITVGQTSNTQTVTVTNFGTTAIPMSAVGDVGPNAADFRVRSGCGTSLGAGASCSIRVSFTPSVAGPESATLLVTSSDPASPQSVSLSGNGLAGALISFNPTSLAFGAVARGTTSAAQTVTVTNTGGQPLIFSRIRLAGNNPGDYVILTNSCPSGGAGLAPGSSCSASVAFKPTRTGTRTATLQFSDNAPQSPQSVALSGTGQ